MKGFGDQMLQKEKQTIKDFAAAAAVLVSILCAAVREAAQRL